MPDGFSTDSYPKPPVLPAQKSLLDQAQQFQQLDQGQLAINQAKLNQANQALGYMTRAMGSLGPDASKDDYLAVGQNAVKMGLVPANMLSAYTQRLQAAPTAKDFYNEFMTASADHQQQINYHLGQPGIMQNGQTATPIAQSPKFGIRATGLPIQTQNPVGTETTDTNPNLPNGQPNPNYGSKSLIGPQEPQIPAGSAPANSGIPGQYVPQGQSRLPVAQPQTNTQSNAAPAAMLPVSKGNITGPNTTVTGVDVQDAPANFNQRFTGAPSGPTTSLPPMYEQGKNAYVQDQQTASAKMLAAKPAIQALPLMQTPGFLSGPLTDQFTKVVAGLKSTGLINIADNADPTAIRQEAVKKLNQYVSNSPIGQRSDNALIMQEASSPNPNVQILPALIKLTKDAVALDRVQAMMPNAFKGQDYQNYIRHKGTFPQSIDEKALTLDLEPEDKSKELVDNMAKQLQSKNNRERAAADKFFKTLRMAKDQGFYQ